MKMVSEIIDGERITSQYLIASTSKGTNAMGSQYITVELKDSSGSIKGNKWEILPEDEQIFVTGNVIEIVADCLKYKDALQLKILKAKLVPVDEIDATRFLKQAPLSEEELKEKYDKYINSIQNKDCKAILEWVINKIGPSIYTHPAAVSIHHDYMCGLLMHSTTMADIAVNLIPIYDADYDLLITGILLHDLGKAIELEGPAVFHYSLEGKLVGHISILSGLIQQAADELKITSETALLLQHMALSHHGHYEYGSPVLPLTKEALLLSLIDNLDCKMVALNKSLETINPGEFTQKVFSLDGRMFYKKK